MYDIVKTEAGNTAPAVFTKIFKVLCLIRIR